MENKQSTRPALMSIEDVAEYLGISRTKVYNLIGDGKLKHIKLNPKLGRITVESLDKFLEERMAAPPTVKSRTRRKYPFLAEEEEEEWEPIQRKISVKTLVNNVLHNLEGENRMASFQDILNRKAGDIKPPPAYPVGTYHCLVDGPPAAEESSQKGTPCRVFRFKILAPGADVNPQDLAQIEGGVVGKIITGQGVGAAFYLVETAVWRYKEFLVDALAIPESKGNGEDKTLLEMEAEAPGKQVMLKLRHEISQDGKRMFHRIDSYARV